MWCFLCDRPAIGKMRVNPIMRLYPRPGQMVEALDVCQDCARRVRMIEKNEETGEYIVTLQSLT